jgi:hypothetical protein
MSQATLMGEVGGIALGDGGAEIEVFGNEISKCLDDSEIRKAIFFLRDKGVIND